MSEIVKPLYTTEDGTILIPRGEIANEVHQEVSGFINRAMGFWMQYVKLAAGERCPCCRRPLAEDIVGRQGWHVHSNVDPNR